jgi:ribosomal protein S18 acetylase RimI-like enzyme
MTALEPLEIPAGYSMREATADDAAGAAACVDLAYRHYIDRNGLMPGPMRDDYAELIRDHDVTIVERGEEIVGVLVLKTAAEGFLLDNVAVLPAHQGVGVGRFLLAHAEDEARRRGRDSICLYTQEIMTENRALYERVGYVEYAQREELGLHRVYLRKQLHQRQSQGRMDS